MRGYDVRVSEYTAHALDGHALAECQCRKAVPCAVEGDVLCDTALTDDFLEPLADRPVVDVPEYGIVSLKRSVSFDDLQGGHQAVSLDTEHASCVFSQVSTSRRSPQLSHRW